MPKQTTYSCIVFLANGEAKKWKYVRDLKSFSNFLVKVHPTWKYFNVYKKASGSYLKRFYPGNIIPKALHVLVFVLASLLASLPGRSQQLTRTEKHLPCLFPCPKGCQVNPEPLKNTFNKTTFNLRIIVGGAAW